MFYRRKYYLLKSEFTETFNEHFNQTNLPQQLKNGSRLVGRWQSDQEDGTSEIFAIWEYDSYEAYKEIESKVRSDAAHVQRVRDWYEKNGGKDHVFQNYFLEVRNEEIFDTVEQ